MNFTVINFGKDNLCISHNGLNKSPFLRWNKIKDAISYALILEDPDAPNNTFIHWYIPYISPNLNVINSLNNIIITENINLNNINNKIKTNKIKLLQGYNSLDNIGYHGPCNPQTNKYHRYIFTLYALDKIIPNINKNLKIGSSNDFDNIIFENNINVLSKEKITYEYIKNGNIILKTSNNIII